MPLPTAAVLQGYGTSTTERQNGKSTLCRSGLRWRRRNNIAGNALLRGDADKCGGEARADDANKLRGRIIEVSEAE